MGPPAHMRNASSSSSSSVASMRAPLDNTSAAAAVMAQGKLNSEAGMAAAHQAAQQAKQRARQQHQEELCEAALTPPQQRTQEQVVMLCSFLSSAHLLRNLQPANIKDLAQTMLGRACSDGELIFRQGDEANNFYVVLRGEVVMYETDAHSASSSGLMLGGQQQRAETQSGSSRASSAAGGKPQHSSPSSANGAARGSPPRVRTAAGNASSSACADVCEVRRIAPREAFGEDDVSAGSKREQSAVAGSVSNHQATLALLAAEASPAAGAAAGSSGSGTARALQPPSSGGSSSSSAASSSNTKAVLDARSCTRGQKESATGAAPSTGITVLLQLSADDYGAALEGRLSAMLEQKVTFLSELPALKGLSAAYLGSLAHCFHQVQFEPREVLVRQGDASDCLYVLKSGQVCILIDPNATMADANSIAGGTVDGPAAPPEVDTKKLVQVCLLGSGSIIGDMSVRDGPGGAPKRSATVVALTELLTYKVPLREFKRRMPADVLEGMRQIASQKLFMNERQASSRTAAAAAGKDGHILLGGAAVPEAVLRGKGLRALLDAQQQAAGHAPVGGLLDALEVFFGTGHSSSSPKRVPPSRAVAVEEYVSSLSRNGFVTAPPQEFLALLTDWRSPREAAATSPADRKLPAGREFPLPVPNRSSKPGSLTEQHLEQRAAPDSPRASPGSCCGSTAASPTAHSLQAAVHAGVPLSPSANGALRATTFAGSNWGRTPIPIAPGIDVQTHVAAPAAGHGRLAMLAIAGQQAAVPLVSLAPSSAAVAPGGGWPSRHMGAGGSAACTSSQAGSSPSLSPRLLCSPRMTDGCQAGAAESAVNSAKAFRETLDQLVQQRQHKAACSSAGSSSNSSCGSSTAHSQAAIVREAAQQLAAAGVGAGAAGNGGGFRGNLHKSAYPRPAAQPLTAAVPAAEVAGAVPGGSGEAPSPKPAVAAATSEPNRHQAGIIASTLFRPGSPISVQSRSAMPYGAAAGNSGSRRGRSPPRIQKGTPLNPASAVAFSKTLAVLDSFSPNISGAVVVNQHGMPELDFHTNGTGQLPPTQPGKLLLL